MNSLSLKHASCGTAGLQQVSRGAISCLSIIYCATGKRWFRPAGRPAFFACAKKVRQRNTPRHMGLAALDFPRAGAAPRVVTKGHPWPIVPHLASLPNAPLRNTSARPPDGDDPTTEALHFQRINVWCARPDSPVRRVSGIGVQGVERHGCRESCAGPGTAHRSVSLERRWSERTRNAAKRNAGPYAGGAFSLLTFSLRKQRESEAPCKAQSVATSQGKCCGPTQLLKRKTT